MARKSCNEYIEALQIFQRNAKDPDAGFVLQGEHDIVYLQMELKDGMSEADRQRLDELGWHISSDCDCWAAFT